MSAEEVLRANETKALEGGEFLTQVTGKIKGKTNKKKLGGWLAGGFITAMLLIVLMVFLRGNFLVSMLHDRLIEETNVQYADQVESKILAVGQALSEGNLPSNTVARLKNSGVIVGNLVNGEFVEDAKGTAVKVEGALNGKEEIYEAKDFYNAVHANSRLYKALSDATYGAAAYYYDESAMNVFKEIGTNRNNFKDGGSFKEVMASLLGEGSDVDVNNVSLVAKENEKGETYYDYEKNGADASSESGASEFINAVLSKSKGSDENNATLKAAESLNIADTLAREQRSSLFYLLVMENLSKTKAGDATKMTNEVMNYLYEKRKTSVVDVKTGEVIEGEGSMLESPSLYAVLSGESMDVAKVTNYANDRILKTVQNQITAKAELGGAVTSAGSTKKAQSTIGRLSSGNADGNATVVSKVTPSISESLNDNSFATIGGISGGEFLVEGAVNVGKKLAQASGASAGDAEAVKSYARLTSTVLAMDAEVERMEKSPFDITSKNTFLGSIVYQLAVSSLKNQSLLSTMASTISSLILPSARADDENSTYLTNFGECETLNSVGAVGSAGCSMVATFDTSTLDDPFNNAEFKAFVEENTTLENWVRKVKPGSVLAEYIINSTRGTDPGVMDGGILKALNSNGSKSSFVSDIVEMVKMLLGSSEEDLAKGTGAAFVDSSSNEKWQEYKWAQRYMSLSRAVSDLRAYDGDETAYSSLKYFEGSENSVLAFKLDFLALQR